jgi:hypothetical protein
MAFQTLKERYRSPSSVFSPTGVYIVTNRDRARIEFSGNSADVASTHRTETKQAGRNNFAKTGRERGSAIASAPAGKTAAIAALLRGFFRGRKPRGRPRARPQLARLFRTAALLLIRFFLRRNVIRPVRPAFLADNLPKRQRIIDLRSYS